MSKPTIRPGRPEEFPAMALLFEQQHREHNIPRNAAELEAGLHAVHAEPMFGFILVAVCGDEIAGVAYAASILSLEHGGKSGWLEEIYLAPEWRGKGLGSELLAAVIAGAQERGWKALDLEVDTAHQRAIPLYQRHGFEPVHRTRFVRRF